MEERKAGRKEEIEISTTKDETTKQRKEKGKIRNKKELE